MKLKREKTEKLSAKELEKLHSTVKMELDKELRELDDDKERFHLN
jgi:hypothetical protein